MKPTVDIVWDRIKRLAGATFETKTGKKFTYWVTGDTLVPSRTDFSLAKTDFKKTLDLLPLDGPGEINNLVRGPAYIWAILHDRRVRGTTGSVIRMTDLCTRPPSAATAPRNR